MKKRLLFLSLALIMTLSIFPFSSVEAQASTEPQLDIEREVVTGVSSLMEYSTNEKSWKAISGTILDVSGMIPSMNADEVKLSIRLKAPSVGATTTITLQPRHATPSASVVRFNGLDDEVVGITSAMEYRIGTTGTFTQGTGPLKITELVPDASQRIQVRTKASVTSLKPASAILNINIPARAAKPKVVYNGSLDAITGVSDKREYRLSSSASWTSCTGTSIPRGVFGDEATTVQVRTTATATARASNFETVNVPAAPAEPPTGITLNLTTEIVTGVTALMEYNTNGTSWKAITGNTLDVSKLIPSATAKDPFVTLRIRVKAVDGGAASQAHTITLNKRQDAPKSKEVKYNGLATHTSMGTETGIIAPVSSEMEYRIGTTGTFTSVGSTGFIPAPAGAAAQKFQIRMAAIGATPSSTILTVTVPARAAAPKITYNGSTDLITGLSAAREYSLNNGGDWIRSTATTLSREVFKDATSDADSVQFVLVRTSATATKPASNAALVKVPAPPAASPTDLVFNAAEEIIIGVTKDMEYSTNGTSWKAITGSTLEVSKFIPSATAKQDARLLIRVKATGTSLPGTPASLATEITLPKRPATPKTADVKFNGITEAIVATTTSGLLEYREGTTGTFTSVEGGIIEAEAGSASRRFQIRVAASSATPASVILNITVPARAKEPNARYNGSNAITGVSKNMEYTTDLSATATWTSCKGTTIPVGDLNDETTVRIRTAATPTKPYSFERVLTITTDP